MTKTDSVQRQMVLAFHYARGDSRLSLRVGNNHAAVAPTGSSSGKPSSAQTRANRRVTSCHSAEGSGSPTMRASLKKRRRTPSASTRLAADQPFNVCGSCDGCRLEWQTGIMGFENATAPASKLIHGRSFDRPLTRISATADPRSASRIPSSQAFPSGSDSESEEINTSRGWLNMGASSRLSASASAASS